MKAECYTIVKQSWSWHENENLYAGIRKPYKIMFWSWNHSDLSVTGFAVGFNTGIVYHKIWFFSSIRIAFQSKTASSLV